ncbi:4-(cytidine 5'-diphospho)-2-C-methyl-D-erythritol kinase [Candidatus Lariskella endosymbiont of Hedychridium roseum]|uniref:4-(cytidine 5'-diphospho)-2-C-methyl-D-erythritol kinase n=1 Tax=Candidatus Lariskella endosymbiont of Hedychridium roseum TaxID=3077949 RepID=UPI0030D5A6AA
MDFSNLNKKTLSKVAEAKLNLFLHITGSLPSNYHSIESIFVRLKLHDTIHVTQHDTLECNVIEKNDNSNIDLHISDNIVLKVARKIQQFSGYKGGAKIYIEKNIPIAAGLGGGSSNAASTLILLNSLWNLALNDYELHNIAKDIGADVPFFLQPHHAFVTGISDIITPIKFDRNIHLLLVNPRVETSTKRVYDDYAHSVKNGRKYTCSFKENLIYFDKLISDSSNDLEDSAIAIHPTILKVITMLGNSKGCIISRMSGSGSTCFGIFEDEDSALNAKSTMLELEPSWWYYFETLDLS